MAAKDRYHEHVKNALRKDGWTITHDPYTLKWQARKKRNLMIDLAAEKLLLAEKDARKIAVEIKSFISSSVMEDLYNAIGQFVLYRKALRQKDAERVLYLAVRREAYDELFSDPADNSLLREDGIKLLVFEPETMEIVQWIPPITS